MNDYERFLEQKKSKVLVENNAQTIFDHLNELVNLGGIHERRWLWELLQNAKDSITEPQKISVEIDFRDTDLVFCHNGTPFSHDEIIHLIYHGSTKKGQLDKTGKFGKGFLTTHLLSRKVTVSGVLDNKKGFKFILDRSGKDPKEIETAMESSWEEFKSSQSNFTTNEFTTWYRYTIDEQGKQIAQKGVNDLPRLLPFVLAFNPKLECISLRTSESCQSFRTISMQSVPHLRVSIITIELINGTKSPTRQTLAMASEGPTIVAIPIKSSGESSTVIPLERDIPRLFYDFPLFGTEDFSFPAVINSSDFNPKSERDGVFLGEKSNEDIESNKRIIEKACELYIELVHYASSEKWRNLCTMAFIGLPNTKDWLDFEWYTQIQEQLLQKVLEKEIVESNKPGYLSPQDAFFPVDSPIHILFDLSLPLFPNKLPIKDHIDLWLQALKMWALLLKRKPEDFDYSLTITKLSKKVSELGNISELLTSLQFQESTEAVYWLNNLFQLLVTQNQKHLFETYAIIPNQNGTFMKKTPTLFIDDQVDDTLKDIAKKIGEDWRDRLVHKSVVLDGSLLAFKTQEEVLVSTVNTIKQLLAKGTQDTSFRHAIIDLFVWLVQHKRLDLLQGFPVVSRKVESELPFVISTLSTTARVLLPVELWQKVPGLFAEVFPQELILSSEYAERVPREGWEYFAENQFAYREPVYEEDTKLESQLIFSEESEYKEHVLETLQCSRIAHLELKDKGVIDRIRKSKPRALLFFKFLLTCVLETDSKWPQCIDVDCECGSKHSIFPSHWFYYVKIRKWVPSASGGSESLSPQSLAKLLENENDIVSKLKEDKPALLLNRFGIGIGELLRNIVTKGDDFKKLEWDKAFGAILTSGLEPRQLLAEFEEREKNREKVKANRELGRMIEQLFEATLQSDEYKCLGFKITRTGIGSDYEVEHDFIDGDQEQLIDLQCSTVKILVEIKSTVRPYVTMTHTQGKKASENEESFCLCVVPIFGSEPTGDIIRSNGRFVTNIGKLLKPKVAEVSSLQELTNETIALGGEIQIDISGSQVKYRINQTVWLKGVTFDEFIALLLARQQIS